MTTRSSDIARDFELGTINEFPVIASDIVYEGSAVGLNSSGYARPLVAGDPFVGFAETKADNSAGSAGAINVRVRKSGIVKLSITSAALTDFGKTVYASDDDTFTYLPAAGGPSQNYSEIGTVIRYVSSGVVEVMFDAGALKYGCSIPPLVGKFHQGIDSASDTQVYPLGTRMRKSDGREYVYAKAGGTIGGNLGAHCHDIQHVGHVIVNTAAASGDTTIKITVGAGDGQSANGNIAAQELAGGFIHIFVDGSGADGKCFTRGIISNTATTGGGTMTVVVDDPIPCALVASTAYAEAIASPYRNIQQTNASGKSVVGIPTCYATSGQFLWLQVKGPGWVSPQAALGVTVALQAVFRHDGSLDAHEYNDTYATTAQHAGYVISSLAAGAQAAPFVNFDI